MMTKMMIWATHEKLLYIVPARKSVLSYEKKKIQNIGASLCSYVRCTHEEMIAESEIIQSELQQLQTVSVSSASFLFCFRCFFAFCRAAAVVFFFIFALFFVRLYLCLYSFGIDRKEFFSIYES